MNSKLLLLVLFSLTIFSLNCSKDEPCTSTKLSEIIVGEWRVSLKVLFTETSNDISFSSDGTFFDKGDIISTSSSSGTTGMWSVSSDEMTLVLTTDLGSDSYQLLTIDCDEITFDYLDPFTFKLQRK